MRKSRYADFLWEKQAYLYADAYRPSPPSLLKMHTLLDTTHSRNVRLAVAAIIRGGWVINRPR